MCPITSEAARTQPPEPGDPAGEPPAPDHLMHRLGSRRLSRLSVAVLVAGIVITGALTAVAVGLYDRNENRLLDLRGRELALLIGSASSTVQTPLASAIALADATDGRVQRLRPFLATYVGPGKQFASVSLWPLDVAHPRLIPVLGTPPVLAASPGRAAKLFAAVRRTRTLTVIGVLHSASDLRLGYGFSTPHGRRDFAVYAESPLPHDRRSRLAANSAFADLHYALFLGRSKRPADLLVTDLPSLPARGRETTERIPFGDGVLTLVATPNGSLGGTFFLRLPLIIALVGVLITLAATALTDRLVRGRRGAEELAASLDRVAAENRQLYAEQRGIAQTLQHALLPEKLPEITGLTASSRFVPGASGIEVGGDWYDLTEYEDGSVLLVVGDVSGQGVRAATTMASLRHAVLAYAARGDGPAELLTALAHFVGQHPHDYFATVLCARIDVARHTVIAASAGHLPPLLIDGDDSRYVELKVGVPIGTVEPLGYEAVTFVVPPGATLLGYTDGLIERRGEVLDVGLERLRAAATVPAVSLDDLVGRLVAELSAGQHDDDTAVVGVRWDD
jgi:serine phosphatase RsbU (regulator of sigma subunit)